MTWESWNDSLTNSSIIASIALIVLSLVFFCLTKRGIDEHHSFDMKRKICLLGLLQSATWFFTFLVNDMVGTNTWGLYSYNIPCIIISLAMNFSMFMVPFYVIWMMLLGGWKKCGTTPGFCSRRIYGAYFMRVVIGFCCWSVIFVLYLVISYWGSDWEPSFNQRLQNSYWFYYFIAGCLCLKISIYSILNTLNLWKHGHQLTHNDMSMKLSALFLMLFEITIMVAVFTLNANVFNDNGF
jgi:hypothetical protein